MGAQERLHREEGTICEKGSLWIVLPRRRSRTMRQLLIVALAASLASLSACAVRQVESTPPTVTYAYSAEADYDDIEERAVNEAVAQQEQAGLTVVTDGEMRRLSFQSQMVQAVEGFGEWDLGAFLWGDWHGDGEVGDSRRERPKDLGVVAPLRRQRSLSAGEFVYLRARTARTPKVTLPSPGLFANFWSPERSRGAYASLESFLEDVARILREEVDELAEYGASYIQLDAPHYPLLLEPKTRAFYEAQGWSAREWLELGVALDNRVMAGIDDVTFGLHLCRGNQASRWLVSGDYGPMAKPIFQRTAAHRLLLEYDDARSGGFEPLRHVPDDKMVVLGLITTKRGELETR